MSQVLRESVAALVVDGKIDISEWTNLQGHELSCTATDRSAWKRTIHTVAYTLT